jgi:hypothetical protein
MKAGTYAVAVEAQIILTRRELAVLNHICSYDHSEYCKGMKSSHYEGGVSVSEMVELFHSFRACTSEIMTRVEASKKTLFGPSTLKEPESINLDAARKLTH